MSVPTKERIGQAKSNIQESLNIDLTGNPFVDTGLAVISVLADLDDIQDLTLDIARKVHNDFSKRLANWNSKLKSFTMVFTNNSPLTNSSIKDNKERQKSYRKVVDLLLANIDKGTLAFHCESCGAPRSLDLNSICRQAYEERKSKAREQTKVAGRDWFPLTGSLGSDAQLLPSASRPVHLCAKCLFAVHYLPLGLILLDGRLAAFQSTSIEFWYELVRNIVNEYLGRIKAGDYEIIGAKEGSRAVTKRLIELFDRLKGSICFEGIQAGTMLQVWRFTNSGVAPAECEIEEIPNPSLEFLWSTVSYGLKQEVVNLVSNEGKKERTLFRCIVERQDYAGLYPRGKKQGASPKLFALYQTKVCGRSLKALKIAHTLANQMADELKPKDFQRIQREGPSLEVQTRNQLRRSMASLAYEGEFTYNDYLALFALHWDGLGDGWRLIGYYLNHLQDSGLFNDSSYPEPVPQKRVVIIRYYAACIFDNYVKERGETRFNTEVLNRMQRDEIGAIWLRRQFIRLAEVYSGFTYGAWEHLCKNDKGQLRVRELLFQMRLLWSEWIHASSHPATVIPNEVIGDSGLPVAVECCLKEAFTQYIKQRGLNRFGSDVLVPLRRQELGLAWFRRRLVHEGRRSSTSKPFTKDNWEDFLKDEEGRSYSRERLFQMHLVLANLYRVESNSKKEEEFS